jgi:hypothetical protein
MELFLFIGETGATTPVAASEFDHGHSLMRKKNSSRNCSAEFSAVHLSRT